MSIDFEQHVAILMKSGQDILETLTPGKCELLHMATGVGTEAGELQDAVKTYVFYNKPIDRENVVEELGDLEFYIAGVRQKMGITRTETLAHNMDKLKKRYPAGYSDQAAQYRADKQDRALLGHPVAGPGVALVTGEVTVRLGTTSPRVVHYLDDNAHMEFIPTTQDAIKTVSPKPLDYSELNKVDLANRMAQRFLAWKLPESFNPDGGIIYDRNLGSGPVGTNLFTAVEATQMVLAMLEGESFPSKAKPNPDDVSPLAGDVLMHLPYDIAGGGTERQMVDRYNLLLEKAHRLARIVIDQNGVS